MTNSVGYLGNQDGNEIPDVIGEIQGYRYWNIQDDKSVEAWAAGMKRYLNKLDKTDPADRKTYNKSLASVERRLAAYRVTDKVTVRAIAQGSMIWEDGEITARCVYMPSHNAPETGCQCGMYCFSTPKLARESGASFTRWYKEIVGGRVKIWGKVIKHSSGYRAQYARIDGLIPALSNEGGKQRIDRLAEQLGVPILTMNKKGEISGE